MIELTIDDRPVEVPEGQTLLQAAKLLGIEIPTLCHHPAVPPAGACRICVVEVTGGGRPGLVPACAYPAQEGLQVVTRSDRVCRSRGVTVQLMLARSPEARVLLDLAEEYPSEPLALERKKDDKCILCGLCVRVCQQVVGSAAICFAGRGADREVSTPYKMLSDVCIGCGA